MTFLSSLVVLSVSVWAQLPAVPLPPAPSAPMSAGDEQIDEQDPPAQSLFVPEIVPVEAPAGTRLVAQAALATQLDRHLTPGELFRDFNGHKFWASSSLDRGTGVFIVFTSEDRSITRIVAASGLHKKPVEIELAPGTRYKISVDINIFDPLGSKIVMAPAQGHRGATHKVSARDLQGLLRKYGVAVPLGQPHLFLYGRDVDPAAGGLAATRSFYFMLDKGLDSKGYVVFEERVPVGQWAEATLGAEKVLLYRPDADALEIRVR